MPLPPLPGAEDAAPVELLLATLREQEAGAHGEETAAEERVEEVPVKPTADAVLFQAELAKFRAATPAPHRPVRPSRHDASQANARQEPVQVASALPIAAPRRTVVKPAPPPPPTAPPKPELKIKVRLHARALLACHLKRRNDGTAAAPAPRPPAVPVDPVVSERPRDPLSITAPLHRRPEADRRNHEHGSHHHDVPQPHPEPAAPVSAPADGSGVRSIMQPA